VKAYFQGDIPWVKSGELPDGSIRRVVEHITEDAVANSSAKVFPAGTLLIALYGATVGKLGILNFDAASNQAVCAIFPKNGIDTKYLFWHLRNVRSDLIKKAVGGAQPNISQGILRNISVPVAPQNQQQQIVEEIEKQFSRLDEAVANLKRVKANLKRYKASVLQASVTGKLTEEWRKQQAGQVEPASKLLERILTERRQKWEETELARLRARDARGQAKTDENWQPNNDKWKEKYKEPIVSGDSNLTGLPDNWTWANPDLLKTDEANAICAGPFGTIFKAKDFRETGVPIIFLRHVAAGKYLTHKPGFMDEAKWNELFKPYSVFGGELLITKLGDPPGVCAIYPVGIGPAMVTPDVIKMSVDIDFVDTKYLVFYFNSQVARKFTANLAFGTTRLRVTIPIFRSLPVPLPSREEQQIIIQEVESRLSVAEKIELTVDANLQRAERLRQSILKQAFSGKLVGK